MNWQHIISTMQLRGLTQKQIAEYCNCAQTTISDLLTGASKQPGYSLGVALIDLYWRSNGTPIKEVSVPGSELSVR